MDFGRGSYSFQWNFESLGIMLHPVKTCTYLLRIRNLRFHATWLVDSDFGLPNRHYTRSLPTNRQMFANRNQNFNDKWRFMYQPKQILCVLCRKGLIDFVPSHTHEHTYPFTLHQTQFIDKIDSSRNLCREAKCLWWNNLQIYVFYKYNKKRTAYLYKFVYIDTRRLCTKKRLYLHLK